MPNLKRNIGAIWEVCCCRFKDGKKNFKEGCIAIGGAFAVLAAVLVGCFLLKIADFVQRKRGKDTFLHS
jgi:hypothetical protein